MNSVRLHLVNIVFSMLPPTRLFSFKRQMLRWAGAQIGSNVRVVSSAKFYLSGQLEIGNGTWIGHEVLITGGNEKVTIGVNVDIGPRVTIVTGAHQLWSEDGKAAGAGYSLPVIIGNGVWVGASSTILGGVVLGPASMIGAGSVVIKDVPPFCLFGGNPAKFIRRK